METAERTFVAVCRLDELTPNIPTAAVLPSGERICLLSDGDRVLAFADVCPHRGHPLSEGTCEAGVLRCALHGWEFSTEDGAAVSPASPFGLELKKTRINQDSIVEVEVCG